MKFVYCVIIFVSLTSFNLKNLGYFDMTLQQIDHWYKTLKNKQYWFPSISGCTEFILPQKKLLWELATTSTFETFSHMHIIAYQAKL